MSETLEQQTYRLVLQLFGDDDTMTLEELRSDPEFTRVCDLVQVAKNEAVEKVVAFLKGKNELLLAEEVERSDV